ncbi:RNA polymerase sigma-70 factor, ECF subfamily [Paenibacillus sp. CF384]|nr:RNA polymerase sigma-70 factor, ECF subfamily [Paenibacillus sp. CF384]
MSDEPDKYFIKDDHGFVVDLQDLKKWYRHTLRYHQKRRRELEEIIEEETGMTMEQLGEKKNRNAYRLWKASNQGAFVDLQDTKEIISDLNHVIEWLHNGRQPGGSKRGIERRSAYQRQKYKDPLIMQAYSNQYNSRSSSTLTEWQLFQIEEALRRLSDRERECYELAHGQGFSHSYIANMLCIQKSSVSEYVERAQKKVSEDLGGNLFLMEYEE